LDGLDHLPDVQARPNKGSSSPECPIAEGDLIVRHSLDDSRLAHVMAVTPRSQTGAFLGIDG